LDTFGYTIEEIRKDGFKIHGVVHNTFDGYSHLTMVKSLSVFMLQLPEMLQQMGADFVLVSGDRGEQLMAAVVGAHLYIPVAHIQAGEISGNIDGTTRHAITKFAHLHFAANEEAAQRVLKMGEEPHRVHNVGAPLLDEFCNGQVLSKEETRKKYSLDEKNPNILFVFHPITEELHNLEKYLDEVLQAVTSFGYRTIVIQNNSDAGSKIVKRKIQEYKKPNMSVYSSLPRADYAGLLSTADVLVGNSSSGILEASTFGLPVVNIGNRQKGRMQGENVINTDYDQAAIITAIQQALSPVFKKKAQRSINPYGDGQSAKRIVEILAQVPIDETLLIKKLTY